VIPILVSPWGFVASWITGRLDLTFNVRPVEESGHTSSRSVKNGAGIFKKIPSDYFDVVIHGVILLNLFFCFSSTLPILSDIFLSVNLN
jgi:hypothetical protein